MAIKIRVDASKAIQMLKDLPVKIQRKAIMSALRDASRLLQKALRAASPKRTGKTRRGIKAGRVRQQGSIFSVSVSRPIIFNILESGVTPREIMPSKKKALAFNDIFAARVRHPGFPGRPIFDPTVRANEAEVVRIFGQKVEQVVKEAEAGVR